MTRRSSNSNRQLTATVSAELMRAPTELGFTPTPLQQKKKSTFWSMYRDDPSINPAKLTPAEIGQLTGLDVTREWADSNFRSWFLNSDTWKHSLEFALDSWMNEVLARIHSPISMSDKDIINLGKLLAEMAGKLQRGRSADNKEEKALPEDEARARFHAAATSLGYVLPEPTKQK